MRSKLLIMLAIVAILATWSLNVSSLIPNDADGDGVPDSVDACPTVDASMFDRNGDGCIDPDAGARHIEYWGVEDDTLTYFINDQGSPDVTNGTDFTALQNAMNVWPSIGGTGLTDVYGGTTTQTTADGLDHVNLITFEDHDYPFSSLVLAVGITTSFESDTLIAGRRYRPGQIYDADMIFNPTKTFKTASAAVGTDIQSTATHEAGHLYGLSHSSIKSSTMFYVLPGGTAARSLEPDDEIAFFKGYADSIARAGANRIKGTVTNGSTSGPVAGAIVFLIDVATGDTTACEYTLPDGGYSIAGLPDGSYYVAIHPIDGSSTIGFIQPGNINALVEATAEPYFLPEYWDAAESATDDPAAKTSIAVAGGTTMTANLVTNVDVTAPTVTSATPSPGTSDAAIDGAYVIRFSEGLDLSTVSDNLIFRRLPDSTRFGGNVAVLHDDSVLAFTPQHALGYGTQYELELETGLSDKSGNGLAAPYVLDVTTEPLPPVGITSLAPNKGVVGNTVVINGAGFDTAPFPTVMFDSTVATVSSATPGQLVVTVPSGATTGPVTVTNSDMTVSDGKTFTVLSRAQVARGYETGTVNLSGVPSELTVTPDGNYAYVATTTGADAVVVGTSVTGYKTATAISYAGGLDGIATTPTGLRVYAVSKAGKELVEIDSDPSSELLFNTVLSTHAVGDQPLGIGIDPAGRRAYVPTDNDEIQIWDTDLASRTYQEQIGVLTAPGDLVGKVDFTPAGGHLLALTTNGDLLYYDVVADTLEATVPVGLDPQDVVVDPVGQRAYVSLAGGDVVVVALSPSPYFVQSIATGGSLRGLDITPGAEFIYTVDRELDKGKVIDLDESRSTFRTVITDFDQLVNPIDLEVSPDGIYTFSVLQGDATDPARLAITTIGKGPTLLTVYPQAAPVGAQIVLRGIDLGDMYTANWVEFQGATQSNTQRQVVDPTEMIVTVPAGARSGAIRVVSVPDLNPAGIQYSNELHLTVLDSTGNGLMRLSDSIGPASGAMTRAVAINPQGTLAFAGGTAGEVYVFDIDPSSPSFHQSLGTIVPQDGPISDLAITADGKAMFVITNASAGVPRVAVVDVDRGSGGFLKSLPDLNVNDHALDNPAIIATSPDDRHALLYDSGVNAVFVINATDLAKGVQSLITATIPGQPPITSIVFHPTGLKAYLGQVSPNGIATVDMDPVSGTFGSIQLTMAIPLTGSDPPLFPKAPESMCFGSDSLTLYVDAVQLNAPAERAVIRIGAQSSITPNPSDSTYVMGYELIPFGGTSQPTIFEQLRVSPIGDRIVYSVQNSAIYNYAPPDPPGAAINAVDVLATLQGHEFAFTPDGTRMYMASVYYDSLRVYDFSGAQALAKVSGDHQSGVENETLPAPIRVQVSSTTGLLSGVAVDFQVAGGGGALISGGSAVQHAVVATDAQGYADIDWQLGAAGVEQEVTASVPGLAGSPQAFFATSVVDPATLPLELSQVLPLNGSTNVSATTAIQATFSRGVDPASVGGSSLFLRQAATGANVPVAYGFTDDDRKVSLTPLSALAYGEDYDVVANSTVLDTSGGNLTNPATSAFTVQASPPPPTISSISPPSGLTGIDIVLSGSGFDPTASNNTVLFNGATATPKSGGTASLTVTVPKGTITGPVRVVAGADTSSARTFTVLVPSASSVDEVLATVGTGAGTKSLAVSPDGAIAYTVSTETDAVIPISVDSLASYSPVTVGDQPVAAVFHPYGNQLYVANFGSNTVSVVDADPDSPDFNTVVGNILVGSNPLDVIVTPDGERVITANAGSNDLSVIDADSTSATYHTVLATVGSGAGAKSLAVSPDGARIYVGTNNGFVVLDASGYGVLATVGTGAGSKSLAVSPDGSLLYVLTTAGEVLIVDVAPGSASENSVLATVGTGAGTKSLAVSPDGTLLYLVQENSNEVIVVSVTVEGGASAFEPVTAPQVNVVVAYEDTVATGNDPSAIAFDPTGTGVAIITQAGENKVIVLNASPFPSGPLAAEVEVQPQTLNLTSKGRYVSGIIELPLAFAPQEIDVSSVKLNDVIPAIPDKVSIADTDGDGIPELVTKFDRDAFQELLPIGEYVPVTISGRVRDRDFFGEDTIRTIRPTVTHPTATTAIAPHDNDFVSWTSPDGYTVDAVDVYYSLDDGQTWQPIAQGIPDNGYVAWQTPDASSNQCRVMVTLYQKGEVLGIGMSEKFTMSTPLAVALQSFDATVEEGVAVMRWRTGLEIGTEGFHLARSQTEGGTYQRVTTELIPARGGLEGASYEYRDGGILPNRAYWYKLEEVTDTGTAMVFGPYKVEFHVSNSLAQNVPNPFNPTTTIKFSIARDENVRLVVYDVAGRRVRTLVDGPKRANFYKVDWDGRNDQGQHVASGVYFYRIQAGRFVKTRKMIMLK